MKTIGLVDFFISEWHANNYPAWVNEICEKKGLDFCIKYAWAQEDISPVDGRSTDEWCEHFGVEKCQSLSELCEKSDYILVLAPSNPEKHLEYAKEVFKYHKNTYIDKTFAPDYAEAKEIFDLAKETGTKFFSSSALRYATELDELIGCKSAILLGGGRLFEEYIIHQVEMMQKIIDEKPLAVKVERQGEQYICTARFENDKNATIVFANALPYGVCAQKPTGDPVYKCVESEFFKGLLADILNFYETGEVSFDTEQTLDVMKIREALIKGKENLGNWQQL